MKLPIETPEQAEQKRDEMYRASGDMICACGYDYYSHPPDEQYEFLHVLCDGKRVKL